MLSAGFVVDGLAGLVLATCRAPRPWSPFLRLTTATVLALTAEPVALEESERVAPPEPAPGEERIHPVDGTVLVYVPGGEYILGADDLEEVFAGVAPEHRIAEKRASG